MDPIIKEFLLQADSKALATVAPDGTPNVVPVSSLRVEGDAIVLVNYFMEKTLENILAHNQVALVAWSKMIGYQVKGTAEYQTSGNLFESIVAWVAETIPGRVVKGILVITPIQIHDIAPDKKTAEHFKGA